MSTNDMQEIQRAQRFYTKLRARVDGWLENKKVSPRVRDYLLLLPDLFTLVIRLAGDTRVSAPLRRQLVFALAYVISPVDVIPDFITGLGLLDDAFVLAFILERLVEIMGQAGEEILREHWEGPQNILETIQWALRGANAVLNPNILGVLRKLFGGSAPEAVDEGANLTRAN